VFKIRMTAGFSLVDAPGVTLAPGESDTMTVKFTAGAVAGTQSGILTFRSNDPDEGGFALNLSGKVAGQPTTTPATTPVAKASVWLVRPGRRSLEIADGSGTPIDFGAVAVSTSAPARTIRVVNIGDATLNLGALQVPAGFSVVEGLKTSLAPGEIDEFTVRMDTGSVGTRQGQIRFTTNDPGASVFNFAVAGTVTPPPVTTPTTDLNGGTLTVNGTSGGDTIVVSGRSASITVTINGAPMSGGPFANVTKVVVNAGGGNDAVLLGKLYINVTANGGPGSDTLVGSIGNDVLNGEGGNDSLEGGGGDDFLLGGDGDDTLTGGDGLDVFHGDAGEDTINALDGLSDSLLDSGADTDVVHRDRVDPAAV
jgi:Ca2+-binding RTX toxin-like protein